MNGKSPTIPAQTLTDQYTIVRGFRGARGAQLVLTAYHPHRGFEWSNVFTVKPEAILKTTQAHALHIADRAARSYGAKCAVKAPDGTLVEPSAARAVPVVPQAPTVHAFNTRRYYSANGQRIAWMALDSGNVLMVDYDRMIDYILVVGAVRTNDTVMAAYDKCAQAPWNQDEYMGSRGLVAELRDIASQVAPAVRKFGEL